MPYKTVITGTVSYDIFRQLVTSGPKARCRRRPKQLVAGVCFVFLVVESKGK